MNLNDAVEGREYIIQAVDSGDEEVDAFLLSLGCYSGEPVTVISHLQGGCIISVKDGRYTIDRELAETILI
jgi:Fe2+ transport system protein FeoA